MVSNPTFPALQLLAPSEWAGCDMLAKVPTHMAGTRSAPGDPGLASSGVQDSTDGLRPTVKPLGQWYPP